MRMKPRADIKSAAIITVGSFLFAWILTFFLSASVEFIGMTIDVFDAGIAKNGEYIFSVAQEICFLISFVVANMILHVYEKGWRKQFLQDTKGLIPIKEGLAYHIQNHIIAETIIVSVCAIGFLTLYLIDSSLSPAGILYRACGIPLGFLVSVLFLIAIQTGHIMLAQYRWRINFLLED